MKLWIDDVRPAPDGYAWAQSVNEAIQIISAAENALNWARMSIHDPDCNHCHNYFECSKNDNLRKKCSMEYSIRNGKIRERIPKWTIEVIDIDHDAGEFSREGGDYIKILDWLEETGRDYPIKIHSMNPVGIQNMRRIIQKNNWKEIF